MRSDKKITARPVGKLIFELNGHHFVYESMQTISEGRRKKSDDEQVIFFYKHDNGKGINTVRNC